MTRREQPLDGIRCSCIPRRLPCPQTQTALWSPAALSGVSLRTREITDKSTCITWTVSHSRYTSRMTTLLLGGDRCVLLAIHTRRVFRCCLPTLANRRRFTVSPFVRCSKDSSMTVLSRYQVTFGCGRPVQTERGNDGWMGQEEGFP